jgi:hypothetical protein
VGAGSGPAAASPLCGLPLPAPLPTAASRAGQALAAALLAKAAAGSGSTAAGGFSTTIADTLDGARPAAAAFAGALLAAAGVSVEAGQPHPRAAHPAYTTTNAAYGSRPPAPHEVAVPAPAIAARAAARAALPPLHPPPRGAGEGRGMRLARAHDWLGTV